MPEMRRAVITDVVTTTPVRDRAAGLAAVNDTDAIWKQRTHVLQESLRAFVELPDDMPFSQAFPAVYYTDPVGELPLKDAGDLSDFAFITSQRITMNLMEQLVERSDAFSGTVHVSVGDPRDDVNKQTLLSLLGIPLPPNLHPILMDPLGGFQAGLRKKPSVEMITDASSSGASAVGSAKARICDGVNDTVIVLSATGKTIPVPAATFPLGFGPDRAALPFEEQTSGHHYSEGGVGLVLHEEGFAKQHRIPQLATVAAVAYGSFGLGVVNRLVVADVINRCLAMGGIETDAPVFIDLYGRGNAIDDIAELSAVELLSKKRPNVASGYLKGDTHYVIGSHGLMGLARVLAALQGDGDMSALAHHPTSVQLEARSRPHFSADPSDFEVFVFLSYSIHGSCVAILVTIDREARK